MATTTINTIMRFITFVLSLWQGVLADDITGFLLIDTSSSEVIAALEAGSVANVPLDGRGYTITAETNGNEKIKFLQLQLDGDAAIQVESQAPYSLGGDTGGTIFTPVDALAVAGTHTITATAFNSKEKALDSKSITFTVVDTYKEEEIMFTLVDATTHRDIMPLMDDATIDISETGTVLTVRADFALARKMTFELDSTQSFLDTTSPFSLRGDVLQGGFVLYKSVEVMAEIGPHEIVVTAWDENDTMMARRSIAVRTMTTPIPVATFTPTSGPTKTAKDGPEGSDILVAAEIGEMPPRILIDGRSRFYESSPAIDMGTTVYEEFLFKEHRYGREFTYIVSGFVPESQNKLTMGFAESWEPACNNGNRIFEVYVNGKAFLENFDIFAEAGCQVALLETQLVQADSAGIYVIEFVAIRQNAQFSFMHFENVDRTESPMESDDLPTVSPTDESFPEIPGKFNFSPTGTLTGELRKWHRITLGFVGPQTNELATPNPFSDYRLDVTFRNGARQFVVPGYYAADGNAANTGATAGNVWLTHFAPDAVGEWSWETSFTAGEFVAQNGGGSSAGYFDGVSGSFQVEPTNKTGRDLRAKGRLEYVGKHHLRFAETGEYFLKAGADSPENFLSYEDFDNTPNYKQYRKSWSPHRKDYRPGDPTWADGKGMNIIGAINYLSSKGMNSFSFIPMNILGDDRNTFPYISDKPIHFQRFDVSKLGQFEIVMDHADCKGLFQHWKLQEHENDQLLDGGKLKNDRKAYYREIIARFGHHLALNYNLGEETTNTSRERKTFANFIRDVDPYNHLIVVHTFPKEKEDIYTPLLEFDNLDGVSMQCKESTVFADTLQWVQESDASGRPWVVANDEQGPPTDGVLPDADDPTHDAIRKDVLWANIMAGGAGVEYYFGYRYAHSDVTCQDWRSRDTMWTQSRHALDFFETYQIPFQDMSNRNGRVSDNQQNWCLSNEVDVLVVYLPYGGSASIELPGRNRDVFSVAWYDPMNGGTLQNGSVRSLRGGSTTSLGRSPSKNDDKDWVVLIRM